VGQAPTGDLRTDRDALWNCGIAS